MTEERNSGLLLHITSLPGRYGIGTLGSEAYAFADSLVEAGQKYWQILPLGPVSPMYGFSPYASSSTFAGNWFMISLEMLAREPWIQGDLLADLPVREGEGAVDFPAVMAFKLPVLKKAAGDFFQYSRVEEREAFERFCVQEQDWLSDYALFSALADYFQSSFWPDWPPETATRKAAALLAWQEKLLPKIDFFRFVQFIFFKQWQAWRMCCRQKGLSIIGDLPIYVNIDSADTWVNPGIFQLHPKSLKPSYIAGLPPDYFSSTGQLWGNPLYRWFEGDQIKEETLAWWIKRFAHAFRLVDWLRIDHFRGFASYWSVDARQKTAVNGRWEKGPGHEFFSQLEKKLGRLPLVAEDLGYITPDVEKLRDDFQLPGMKILQFAFDGNKKNPHLPDNFQGTNWVIYTGTHDNNTVNGWFFGPETDARQRNRVRRYLGINAADAFHWHFIRLALESRADLAVIPVQDLLGLGPEARMNLPGTGEGNWRWKLTPGRLNTEILQKLKKMCIIYRLNKECI